MGKKLTFGFISSATKYAPTVKQQVKLLDKAIRKAIKNRTYTKNLDPNYGLGIIINLDIGNFISDEAVELFTKKMDEGMIYVEVLRNFKDNVCITVGVFPAKISQIKELPNNTNLHPPKDLYKVPKPINTETMEKTKNYKNPFRDKMFKKADKTPKEKSYPNLSDEALKYIDNLSGSIVASYVERMGSNGLVPFGEFVKSYLANNEIKQQLMEIVKK